MGDGMLIRFPLGSDVVRCAIEIQEEAKNGFTSERKNA
jgi:hypothetical protein